MIPARVAREMPHACTTVQVYRGLLATGDYATEHQLGVYKATGYGWVARYNLQYPNIHLQSLRHTNHILRLPAKVYAGSVSNPFGTHTTSKKSPPPPPKKKKGAILTGLRAPKHVGRGGGVEGPNNDPHPMPTTARVY